MGQERYGRSNIRLQDRLKGGEEPTGVPLEQRDRFQNASKLDRLTTSDRDPWQKVRHSGAFRRADERIRTADPFITSEVLYQLSYVGAWRILGAELQSAHAVARGGASAEIAPPLEPASRSPKGERSAIDQCPAADPGSDACRRAAELDRAVADRVVAAGEALLVSLPALAEIEGLDPLRRHRFGHRHQQDAPGRVAAPLGVVGGEPVVERVAMAEPEMDRDQSVVRVERGDDAREVLGPRDGQALEGLR